MAEQPKNPEIPVPGQDTRTNPQKGNPKAGSKEQNGDCGC